MVKSVAFIVILIYAGIRDIKTRTISDWISALIILLGLIKVDILSALIGLVFVPLPYLVMALIKEDSIGGGDIKLMGACGFYLGIQYGYMASMMGLLIAIIGHLVYSMAKGKTINQGIPLAPYLGTAFIVVDVFIK